MREKTKRVSLFSIISAIVFGIMTIILAYAAWHNRFHIILAAGSALMTVISIYDNIGGKSIAQWFKERKNNGY